MTEGGTRRVELVVNGVAVATQEVDADGKEHNLTFTAQIDRSSWVALRQFPQMHTNPVNVLVGDKPIRASRQSARWCIETINQLWRSREKVISPQERDAARETFQAAIRRFERIATDAAE